MDFFRLECLVKSVHRERTSIQIVTLNTVSTCFFGKFQELLLKTFTKLNNIEVV